MRVADWFPWEKPRHLAAAGPGRNSQISTAIALANEGKHTSIIWNFSSSMLRLNIKLLSMAMVPQAPDALRLFPRVAENQRGFATVTKKPQGGENITSGFRIGGYRISSPAMTNVLPFPRKQGHSLWEPQERRQKAKPQKMWKPRSQLRARQIILQCRNLFLAALVGGLVTQYAMNSWMPNSHSTQQPAPLASAGAGTGQP